MLTSIFEKSAGLNTAGKEGTQKSIFKLSKLDREALNTLSNEMMNMTKKMGGTKHPEY